MRNAGILIAVIAVACVLYAQTFRGGIEGTITDSTGAAIPQAQVTAKNAGTGLARTTQTDDQGFYFITELPLGEYVVTASKSGFRTATIRAVRVEVSARERINLTLQPGNVEQTIEVTGEAPLVESTVNNMGGTIEGKQASELPVNGRDFTKLLIMVPGAAGDNSGGADSPGSFGLFSANGSRGRSNNYLLDGTDMNDGYRNLPAINQGGVFGTPATILPVDALAEIPVISNGEAEYGRNSGAIVNMVTKSGTNRLHGSVYEYFRNNALDARNYFNFAPSPQNKFHNNQFGGSLGGPIMKDRTFFFVAYEGQREAGGLPFTNHLPSQQQITDFVAGEGVVNPVICNLLRLQNGCTTPNPTYSPWGQALPVSNDKSGAGADVLQTVHFTNRVDSLIGKIDQHFGKDLLTGRYFFGDSDQSFPLALLGGGTVPGYNTVTPTRVQILSLSYTHVMSPKTLLEIRGGWNRFNESFFPQDSTFDPSTIGLITRASGKDFGLPLIVIGTPGVLCSTPPCPQYAPIGANASVPRGRIDTNWQLFANASHSSGKHNLKWGYEFRRTAVNGFFDAGYRSKLVFADFAGFLTGDTGGTSSHQLQGDSHRHTFQNSHAWYVQDNWRLTSRLTLNLGLRWDYFGVIGEKNGLFSLFDPTLAAADNGTVAVRQVSQLYPKDYNNFAPRVSFAWDVFGRGKTVLRGGYGIFYDAFSQDFFVGQLPWPTYNSGPAYNYLGPSNPFSIQESYCVGGASCSGHITAGQPVFDYGCNSFGCPFGNDTFTVDQRIRTPYVQNYNLNIQHELGRRAALQVGYVGSAGRKLFEYIDANQINPATGTNPYGFPAGMGFGYLLDFGSQATSIYNSLQTSLRIRDMHGLTSVVNYTWSHSIDTASDGQDYVPNATQPDNSYNRAAERANSNFDQRHRFVWSLTYELPKSQTMKPLLSGWAVDSVVTLTSGNPYNVSFGTETFHTDYNGTNEYYGRPDVVGNPFASAGSIDPKTGAPILLNLSALAVPCNYPACDSTHIGNLPRNAFVGPHFRDWDFSLVKNTPIGERLNMQLRADFFNILNHPNFANPLWPGYEVDMLHNGISPIGRGIGYLSSTVTPDVGLGNPFLGGGGPRDIQLAVKLTF